MDFGSPTLNACLMLTFVSWSRDKKVHVADHESRAEALLENVEGKYGINEVNVQPSIVLTSEPDIELLGDHGREREKLVHFQCRSGPR
jgi:hypothetical protein